MNYLGHLFLAGENKHSIVGNYLGDFIKGNLDTHNIHDEIKLGIHMHRKIDALADQKIISVLSNNTLAFSYRRYAGITFDLACDHFLAKNWQEFSKERQLDFSNSRLSILKENQNHFNNKAKLVLERMESYQWLNNYQHIDFIEEVFEGIHRRFPKENQINEAFKDLTQHYSALEDICMQFITELNHKNLFVDLNRKQ